MIHIWLAFKKMPFRKKLIYSYTILISLALTSFALFFVIRFIYTSKQQISMSIGDNAATMSSSINLQMSEIEMILSSVHADRTVQDSLQMRHETSGSAYTQSTRLLNDSMLTTDLFRNKTKWIHLFASSLSGYPSYGKISIHTNSIYNNIFVSDMPWYKKAQTANGVTSWHYNREDALAGVPSIFASRCVKKITNPNVTIGMLRAVIDVESFSSILRAASAFEGSNAILYIDGHPVASSNREILGEERFEALLPVLLDSGGAYHSNAHYMAASSRIRNQDWYVVLAVPTSVLYATIQPYIFTVLAIWVVLMVVTLAFGSILSSYFSTPINELSHRMLEFGTQLDLRLPASSDEEIGRIYSSFNAMVFKIHDLIESEKLAERQKKQAEIRILQAQINPHFIYNTLESIKALAVKSSAHEAVHMITSFGSFLRGSLNNGKHFTTLQKELAHVTAYIEIQQIRFQNSFRVTTDFDADILECITVNIILQPLVENCIAHGFFDIAYPGEIALKGYREDDMIVLQVCDNGCGADIDEMERLLSEEASVQSDEHYSCVRNVWTRLFNFFQNPSMHFRGNARGGLTVEIRFEALATYIEHTERGERHHEL